MQAAIRGVSKNWSPVDLGANLLAWWDAEDAASIAASSGLVSSWTDKVAGVQLGQSISGSRPVYSSNSFNNRPGLFFDGTDDYLFLFNSVGVPYPVDGSVAELWVLVDSLLPDNVTTSGAIMSYGSATSNLRELRRTTSGGFSRLRKSLSGVLKTNTQVAFNGRKIGRGMPTLTTLDTIVDGVPSDGPVAVTPTGSATRVVLGASATSAYGNYFNGIVAAAFITTPLTEAQAVTFTAYLKERGGI